MPKMFSSEFQIHSFIIVGFKINTMNPLNPISTMGGVKISNLLLGLSYNMPKRVDFKLNNLGLQHLSG